MRLIRSNRPAPGSARNQNNPDYAFTGNLTKPYSNPNLPITPE